MVIVSEYALLQRVVSTAKFVLIYKENNENMITVIVS